MTGTQVLLISVIALSMSALFVSGSQHCRAAPAYGWVEKEFCKKGYAIRCENSGMEHVPVSFPRYHNSSIPCVLDLSHNKLKHIKDYSFVRVREIKVLFMFNNYIRRIDSQAFANLTNLLLLNLSSNHLHYPESFGRHVFLPLTNLTYINLKNNSVTSYDGLEELLSPLHKLKFLYISGCFNCNFAKSFENFTHLENISLAGIGCNISVVSNNMFEYLPQVRNVFMSHCQIRTVEKAAFAKLKRIQRLDISYNDELQFKGMRNVLQGLENSSIVKLKFNHIHEQYEMGLKLEYEDMKPIQHLSRLQTIVIDLNKIEVVDGRVFQLLPNATKTIGLTGNRLTAGRYLANLTKVGELEELDLSYQHINYDPFNQQHYEHASEMKNWFSDPRNNGQVEDTRYNEAFTLSTLSTDQTNDCLHCVRHCKEEGYTCVCLPPKLKYLKYRKSLVYFNVGPFGFCPPLSIEYLDFSFNLLMNWTGPVVGLGKLKRLNLNENFCQVMSSKFFNTFHSLTYLNVSYNFLGKSLQPNGIDDDKHFMALTQLQVLDLSENRIMALSKNIFGQLVSLRQLNISRNMLSVWNSTLNAKCLELLDLSCNKLDSLPESLRVYLDRIAGASSDSCHSKDNNVKLVLSGNPILCNCESRPFIDWLLSTSVDFMFSEADECRLPGGSKAKLSKDAIPDLVKRLDKQCFPYVSVTLSITMFILGTALCGLVYRYRWKLRHWYYSKRKRHHHKGYDRLFERDAFLSYASTDGKFIKESLVPALEEERGLKVWAADRDSVPGISVAENIAHAISFSKKTVLLLSKQYLKEGWCDYEMNLARMESIESQRKLFIIVLFEDVSTREIPLDFLRLLQAEQSVEYPTNPQHLNVFWDSLCDYILSE